MATGNARRLMERGIAGPLAQEIARQITAGVGDFRRLGELGVTGRASKLIATAISTGVVNINAMSQAGVIPNVAREISTQVGGGTPTPTPTPITISGTPGAATVGTPYTFTPTTQNGSGTKAFALTGTLPASLTFSTTTGAITGTPTTAATTTGLNISVTDDTGSASLGAFSLVVAASGGGAALALAGPQTYATNMPAGVKVADISNVPSGATPTITPNDGRLAIAGSQAVGWKVVKGMSASTTGTLALTVSATGATSASANVPITGPTLRSAVTYNRVHAATDSGNTGQQRQIIRWPFVIGQDVSDLTLHFPNWYTDNAGEHDGLNNFTINATVIELNGAYSPALFAGSVSRVSVAGEKGDTAASFTDRLAPTAFGFSGGKIPAGSQGWVKIDVTIPTGGKIPVTVRQTGGFSGSRATFFNDTEGTQTIDTINKVGDWVTSTTGGTGFNAHTGGYCPLIFGTPLIDVPCIMFSGDSNPEGLHDNGSTTPMGLNGYGFIQRALTNATKDGNWVPALNFSRSGNAVTTLLGTNTYWRTYLQYVNQWYNGMGENDFGTTNTNAVLTTVQSNHLSLFALVRGYSNIRSIGAYYLMPRLNLSLVPVASMTAVGTTVSFTTTNPHNLTTGMQVLPKGATPSAYNSSSGVNVTVTSPTTGTYTAATAPGTSPATGTITLDDQYQTLANQVTYTDWVPGGKADQFRLWMQSITGTATGPDWALTFNAVRDSTANPMFWKTDGVTPYLMTNEGSHLYGTGASAALGRSHELIAAELRPILAAMV